MRFEIKISVELNISSLGYHFGTYDLRVGKQTLKDVLNQIRAQIFELFLRLSL